MTGTLSRTKTTENTEAEGELDLDELPVDRLRGLRGSPGVARVVRLVLVPGGGRAGRCQAADRERRRQVTEKLKHNYYEGDQVWVQDGGSRVLCYVVETYWIQDVMWLVSEVRVLRYTGCGPGSVTRFTQPASQCRPVSS